MRLHLNIDETQTYMYKFIVYLYILFNVITLIIRLAVVTFTAWGYPLNLPFTQISSTCGLAALNSSNARVKECEKWSSQKSRLRGGWWLEWRDVSFRPRGRVQALQDAGGGRIRDRVRRYVWIFDDDELLESHIIHLTYKDRDFPSIGFWSPSPPFIFVPLSPYLVAALGPIAFSSRSARPPSSL